MVPEIGRNGPISGHFGVCFVLRDERLLNRFIGDGPLTSIDEGLYALACEEDVRCLATILRRFKLIEVYIEHGVTALDYYIRPPRFRATIEDISDEPGSITANRTEKILLLTWHESSEPTKEHVRDSVTPSSLPQHDSSTHCVAKASLRREAWPPHYEIDQDVDSRRGVR
uniref:Uncharacterized protein n=1 Tax=Tanacetum cinerariifolium TaxID=118510 RepID=A0A699JL30_TANCI|nr:hypothetical protein [Tanacetum cinerariifolium]